jgi:hypothetical protein
MNASLYLLVIIGVATVCIFATGIYSLSRGQVFYLSDNVKEALLWGGGFIIYAVADYFIFMH